MGKFSDIPGNESLKKALVGMVDNDRVPHALLLHENDGCGAILLALTFLQYANCQHRHDGEPCGECPVCNQFSKLIYQDLHYTFPTASGTKVKVETKNMVSELFVPYWRELVLENPFFLENDLSAALGTEKKSGQIVVAEGQALLKDLNFSALSGGYKSALIYLPEQMTVQTANMLLKTLEEPGDKTLFVLITHSPDKVLPTIFSRCQLMRVQPILQDEISNYLIRVHGIEQSLAQDAASVCGGSLGLALQELSAKEDVAILKEISVRLFENLVEKNLPALLEISEELAALESREKQKLFCTFAGDILRKVFMLQQNMDSIAAVSSSESDFVRYVASKAKHSFARNALDVLTRAVNMIDRNVSQKIIFSNMVLRLYQII